MHITAYDSKDFNYFRLGLLYGVQLQWQDILTPQLLYQIFYRLVMMFRNTLVYKFEIYSWTVSIALLCVQSTFP
jgi:hypothetical protein